MAWATSDRSARLPSNWSKLRLRVLRRDGWLCQIHGDGCRLVAREVDHVVAGDDHSMANLQSVCVPCHKRKTQAESATARAAMPRMARGSEPHPGVIA